MDEVLIHHGIKGQKWGVRRYEKYDGSLTRAGLKRYYKSQEEYNKRKEDYQNAKNSGDKAAITNKRIAMNTAKKRMNKDYKHLKQDKLADQGKELYSKNVRITGNEAVTRALSGIGGLSLSAAGYLYQSNDYNRKVPAQVKQVLLGIGGASLVGSGVNKAISYGRDKKLRAYYSHTSNY